MSKINRKKIKNTNLSCLCVLYGDRHDDDHFHDDRLRDDHLHDDCLHDDRFRDGHFRDDRHFRDVAVE